MVLTNHHSLTSIVTFQIEKKNEGKQLMGPLFFNIYLNDIFYFVNKCDITNYADDTTPYAVGTTMDTLLNSLEDTKILIKWFRDNYFQPNADKCHLLQIIVKIYSM